MSRAPLVVVAFCVAFAPVIAATVRAADWPCYGRDATRNPVSPESGPPTDWNIELPENPGPPRNVKWTATLGSLAIGSPIVSGGLVWVCSNNEGHFDPSFQKDASCLLCFDERDGHFLWQHLSPRIGERTEDWPYSSAASPPLVEGDRLWFLTSRWEVVCLDIAPLLNRTGTPRQRWKLDLRKDLGVFGHCPSMAFNVRCAIGPSYKGLIYVITGNGIGPDWRTVPAPDAPGLLCLEKDTGKVVWKDASPGKNILEDQVSSPLVAEVNGRAQVIAPQGDGWVLSFDALSGKPIWQFDANPKDSVYPRTRNELMATPVLYEGRVYIGTGQSIEHGEGPGLLWCIDPTKEGEVSAELDEGPAEFVQPKDEPPLQAGAGPRKGRPNPNSAAVWRFEGFDANGDGKIRGAERMNRMTGSVAASDGLVFAADYSG